MTHRFSFPLPPLVDDGSPGNRTPQRLAATGTTESRTSRALKPGKKHIIMVGSAGVRIRLSASNSLSMPGAVDATRDIVLGPWTILEFTPESSASTGKTYGSTWVYAEAADGAAAYECFVVQFEP